MTEDRGGGIGHSSSLMLKLAIFDSMNYSFNTETGVSNSSRALKLIGP